MICAFAGVGFICCTRNYAVLCQYVTAGVLKSSRHVFCLADDVAVNSGVAEVMSLVTGLAADAEAGSQEVTGPTDPIRVIITHTLQPDSSSITFSIELLSRLTADIKGLVLRYYVTKCICSSPEELLNRLYFWNSS